MQNIPIETLIQAMQNLPTAKGHQFGVNINHYYKPEHGGEICLVFVVNRQTENWELDLIETFNKSKI